ncbi:bile acid:sodium symporter family protein [Flagellimonas halotolerans]|uniref:Bile acid:sodium symporter family protein n=1 Tax=Flagellimonas halotolerans TaxID=3112164 RepID=A0ABU6IPL5_9FLAO|nr:MULTISPECIES: bile acid:sodium symporter family protein [unclassified Allomuricauda]MEC3965265.1 bile acid:sodium symporter family protein [Muricauda sp. SYSU M86414]MEC4264890.1 bile acid:sodium symporter family protein [Muricauda sp. SYSU M84420]
MKKPIIYKISLGLAVLSLLIFSAMALMGELSGAGMPIVLFFVLLALGFSGYKSLRDYVFAVLIFAGVSLSLYWPQYFVQVGEFKLTGLIIPLIQIIMFGMGTSMSVKDFAGVVKSPKGVLVGVVAQLAIMPLVGYGLANLSGFAPEIAAGIILIGCSPSGVASNVMAYLAKANLALSITITSIATLLAPFVTPLLMKLLAGQFVDIDVLSMMWSITKMIILPIGAGLLFNHLLHGRTKWLDNVMPLVSMFAIGLIIIVITAAGRDSLLDIGALLLLLVLVHNVFGYTLGYWFARTVGMNERDSRTISIEVGMQNGGLASGIANTLGKIATMGLAPAVFGPLMNITGSILASYWHKNVPVEETRDM